MAGFRAPPGRAPKNGLGVDEEKEFKEAARYVLRLTDKQIEALLQNGDLVEVFSNYLNDTPHLVSKWDRGEKRPSGPALKRLSLVEKRGIAAVV